MYTTSMAFLEALTEAGVSYLFANFGSDHAGLLEALAEGRSYGRALPKLITCPNEMVALSMAHGYAQLSGRAQAVIVHVECGTQAMAGAMHNAAKGRIPVLIFAGASPFTQEGELLGSRNEFIQWIQDVSDQRGIVRGYVKYDNEIRTGRNVKQIVHRAMQISHSEPRGPVYLMGAREVMESETKPVVIDSAAWAPLSLAALNNDAVSRIFKALVGARSPLVVTTYLGRRPNAVTELVRLCRRLGVGVLESVPSYMNFPHDDPLYQGSQWNDPNQNPILAAADVVLVIDSDVPWIPSVNRPSHGTTIFHIDTDPLKAQMPLWYIGAQASYFADAETALRQLNQEADRFGVDEEAALARRLQYSASHALRLQELSRQATPDENSITPEHFVSSLRGYLNENSIIINEAISNYHVVFDHLAMTRPGSIFTSGGGSLGWNGGAAIGAKLAIPDAEVIAITGDGSFLFSVPSSVHWIARRYDIPFLQIVMNNRGWKSPKLSTLAVHPNGYASRADDLGTSFDSAPDYSGIAAASGGAYARVVKDPMEINLALNEALNAVRIERRCAVLDVWLPHLNGQACTENMSTGS